MIRQKSHWILQNSPAVEEINVASYLCCPPRCRAALLFLRSAHGSLSCDYLGPRINRGRNNLPHHMMLACLRHGCSRIFMGDLSTASTVALCQEMDTSYSSVVVIDAFKFNTAFMCFLSFKKMAWPRHAGEQEIGPILMILCTRYTYNEK